MLTAEKIGLEYDRLPKVVKVVGFYSIWTCCCAIPFTKLGQMPSRSMGQNVATVAGMDAATLALSTLLKL